MADGPRMSKQTLGLLERMLADAAEEWFGLELSRDTGIAPGTMYPILHRLERSGWLESRIEAIDPVLEKRPARRLYRLTGKGELAAEARLRGQRLPRRLLVARLGHS
jgi:PadR family transcriptional regulator, regulatory protein PadR